MQTYNFTFVVNRPAEDDYEDKFFEAGCDDATLLIRYGLLAVTFDREAESYKEAVLSAYSDIRRVGLGIVRFDPDYLVGASEIAKRANITRAAVSNYVKAQRKDGFPVPCALVTSKHPLWDWVEVSRWLHQHGQLDAAEVQRAAISRAVNVYVQIEARLPVGDVRDCVEADLLEVA